MYDLSILKQFSLAGKSYVHQQTLSKEGFEGVEASIPVAWAGVLTTRTDDDTGTITANDAGHLITTAAIVDIYWDGGSRRNILVGTVAGTSIPFGASGTSFGDVLPAATTAVQVCVVQEFDISLDGDALQALVATAENTKATICLYSTGDTVEELALSIALGGAYDWITGNGANPITGDTIDKVHMSIADTVAARNVRVGALLDS
jgi:hypothetical protein